MPWIVEDFYKEAKVKPVLDKTKLVDMNIKLLKHINTVQTFIMDQMQQLPQDVSEDILISQVALNGYIGYCKLADEIEITHKISIHEFIASSVHFSVFEDDGYKAAVKMESSKNPLSWMLGDQFKLPDITEIVAPTEEGFILL